MSSEPWRVANRKGTCERKFFGVSKKLLPMTRCSGESVENGEMGRSTSGRKASNGDVVVVVVVVVKRRRSNASSATIISPPVVVRIKVFWELSPARK